MGKKRKSRGLALLAALCLCLGLGGPTPTAAAAGERTAVLRIGSGQCLLDGQLAQIDPENPETAPVIRDSRTLLPIRRLIEHFGGSVEWDGDVREVSCYLNGSLAILTIDSGAAVVDGQTEPLDVPAQIIGGRTFVPVRFVSESLGLRVAWDGENSLVAVSDGPLPDSLAQLPGVPELLLATAPRETPPQPEQRGDPVAYTQKIYNLPSGNVRATVVTVDLSRVRLEARHADGTINHTARFSDIVAESGADVVINANFFNGYDDYKTPVGSLVSNGLYLYSDPGGTFLGVAEDGTLHWGNSSYVRIESDGGSFQSYYLNQEGGDLYSSGWGPSVAAPRDAWAVTFLDGFVRDYRPVAAGEEIPIPAGGYVAFRSGDYQVWDSAECVTYMITDDQEHLPVTQLISGNPRLVKDGEQYYVLTTGFTEARFTTAVAARTAVGTTADGRLILVNTGATIQQMRELMLSLGCQNAVNLDGGGSSAMYCLGKTLCNTSRLLTCTLHIFVTG